jgi:manganese/iron transport system permease protein
MDAFVMTDSMLTALETSFWVSLFAAPLGCFLIFRKLSFFGDALGHSTMAGIAVAYLLFGSSILPLSIGAAVSGILAAFVFQGASRVFQISSDIALTVTYSTFFALGLYLLSQEHVHLDNYLMGDLWNINPQMLWFVRIWAFVVWFVLGLRWKAMWLNAADPDLARSLGYSRSIQDFLVIGLVAISVVGMIQAVGVVLLTAYLVIPAAAALPWARSLKSLMLLSVAFALAGSFMGIFLAALEPAWHSGPCLALTSAILFAASHGVRWILRSAP